jgi:hypothetical protein
MENGHGYVSWSWSGLFFAILIKAIFLNKSEILVRRAKELSFFLLNINFENKHIDSFFVCKKRNRFEIENDKKQALSVFIIECRGLTVFAKV